MKRNSIDMSLQDDTRAVAPLVGFILLFGFLVIAFTGYQAQVVPQQNAETEFEHFQQNHNEMVEFRSAILTAGASDRPQFPTIQLGTNYQTRLLAVNGPPPAGLLQTSDAYPITISDGTTEVVVDTRFIEYQPGYNELDVGSTWYENSVLYLDELESSGGLVIAEDQNLVTDGDTLRITALQNDFQRSGTNRITVELYPTSVEGDISDLEENEELSVSLPTRLDSDYWVNQFEDSSSVAYDNFEDSGIEPNINKLNLTVNNVSNLELNTVGIREEPNERSAKNVDPYGGSGGGGGGGGGGAAGAIQVTPDVKSTGNSGKFAFGLENTGSIDVEIVAIGINETTQSDAEKVDAKGGGDLILGEDTEGQIVDTVIDFDSNTPAQADRCDFTTNIEIIQNNERTFRFQRFLDDSDKQAKMKGESVTITIWFSDGTSSTLLLDPNA
jgi:hypothetical protein